QATPFTVVGVGDMSGDVFGNGMLLSRHLRIVAAFDHRHVFLDPDPDPAASFAERERLFGLPRSSWADYDTSLLSAGGGVHPRTAKSIPISAQVRARLGLPDGVGSMTPAELMKAILAAPVDLLWNGGIGTYVKASTESHADVGDKANDAIRVDGADLRVKVVGEGGNLGLTQLGRIEFAVAGGHINTDAIDNSAGVDTSDHEVNIKILLDRVVAAGELTVPARNELLQEMTDDVAALVLRDNYRQNRALANARAQAASMEDVHARFIRALEQQGDLKREVERLPNEEELLDRRAAGIGLTVPELAVLLAYAKIDLEDAILATALPDDPDFSSALSEYFPRALAERYRDRFAEHPLRREIVATALVNGVVNRAGTTFAFRLAEETGATADEILRAHEAARAVFGQAELWSRIEELDGVVAADTQTAMYLESRKLVERASRWLLRRRRRPLPVATTADFFTTRVARVADLLPARLRGAPREHLEAETARLTALGVGDDLARRVAGLDALYAALDITDLAEQTSRDVDDVLAVYVVVGERLGLDRLRERIVELPRDDRWQALSRRALQEDVETEHRSLTAAILASTDAGFEPETAFGVWAAGEQTAVTRVLSILDDVRGHGVYDLATLSVAIREIRSLV
ncbi:MAG: NAD-glutamate dehydrogenase domain-containing protein, partial [Acidimicrobiia bacterium]